MNTFDSKNSAIPGATSLSYAVMRGMQRPYVNPWSDEFLGYFDDTLALLKNLYNTDGDVLVMIGPIRMAMDSVVCSLLEPGETLVAMTTNGYWSELFTVIAQAHGATPYVISEKWGLPINPDKVRQQLDKMSNRKVKALFATHVETSTGVVNPIEELGQIAKERGIIFVVDAAQTLGGMEVCVDDWGIDFCISGNHKCMSAPAGLNYVAISDRGWQAIEKRTMPIQGWYTNLLVWKEVWMQRQSGFFTFPSSLLFGLRAALDLMFDMGLQELYRRYDLAAKAIRRGGIEFGLELVPYVNYNSESIDKVCANTVTAFKYPLDIRHQDLARIMHDDYHISIAGTYGPYTNKAFRVGPTGLDQIERSFTLHLISCLGLAFNRLGFNTDIDRALVVADTILGEI